MPIRSFLTNIDAHWQNKSDNRIPLQIIGSTALMLQADYQRGTTDSDVLETSILDEATQATLLDLAGKGSVLHKKHKLYIDLVKRAILFLPQTPIWHTVNFPNLELEHFDIKVLDVVDVVVSKLKRFSPSDQIDIDAMIEMDLVPHNKLIQRFRAAVDCYSCDARADDLPRYVENLHRVERDFLLVEETEIELPGWV